MSGTWRRVFWAHPVITSVMLCCVVVGAGLGLFGLTEEWSIVRRLFAGAVAGGGVGLIVTATRMIG